MVQNDEAAQPIVTARLRKLPLQLEISPGAGDHYIAVNNKQGPFANVDVRKAFWAALDRDGDGQGARRRARDERDDALHLPRNPRLRTGRRRCRARRSTTTSTPKGNAAVAAKYMKLAGYPSGRYTGGKTLQVVGVTGSPSADRRRNRQPDAEEPRLQNAASRSSTVSVMYAKYCGVPAEEIDVCPSVGWVADFGDPQAVLDVPFNGQHIDPDRQPQLGPGERPADQRGDGRRGTGRRRPPRARKRGRRSTGNWSPRRAAIPFAWDKQPNIESSDVAGVGDLWNTGDLGLQLHLAEVTAGRTSRR